MTDRVFTLPAPLTSGSFPVPAPISDGDTATFRVVPHAPTYVDYSPSVLTWAGLKAEMKANPGRQIGLGASRPAGWYLTSVFEPDPDVEFNILQLAPISSSVDASSGLMYVRRPHGVWEMRGGGSWDGPVPSAAAIRGIPNANNNEQHHGIRQDGGDIEWINPVVFGVHGDCMAMRLWAKANGGDDVPPQVHVVGGLLSVGQRCGIGVIVARAGSLISGVTFQDIGTWPIDVETNATTDVSGSLTIDGCTFHRHNIAGNQSWGQQGVIGAIQYAGPSTHGPDTISNCTGEQLDIVAVRVPSLTLINLASVNPAKLVLISSKATKSNVVNIS